MATAPTAEQVLDELGRLATVEHALVVEYLTVHAALGHDLPAGTGEHAASVQRAAQAAFVLALGEMGHLRRLNNVLVAAGRAPEVGRASSITAGTSEIALGPPSPAELERLLDREKEIAAAVDAAYAPLCRALADGHLPFEEQLLEPVAALLDPRPDHVAPLAQLEAELAGIPPSVYVRASRREPGDELERALLALGDRYYATIVATVEAMFAYDDRLDGELRGRALATMDGLNAINLLLAKRGVLPSFARVAAAGGQK
jgi:hypothetical protein